jgi:hypothetical protein
MTKAENILFDSFGGDEFLQQSKKELDLKMKLTTEHLEQKINKAKELDLDEGDDDDDGEAEKQPTFDGLSVIDQSEVDSMHESALNKSITIKELKSQLAERQQPVVGKVNADESPKVQPPANEVEQNPRTKIQQYEERLKRKEARENIFKKLQEQINQFRKEIPATDTRTNESSSIHGTSSISPKR